MNLTCISCRNYLSETAKGADTFIHCARLGHVRKRPLSLCEKADRVPGRGEPEDWDDDLPDGDGLI